MTDHNELRDRLADAMCRHSLTRDWYEKADLVLADLPELRAARRDGTAPQPELERLRAENRRLRGLVPFEQRWPIAGEAAAGSATPTRHTRTSTSAGPDYCAECSAAVNDWVPWPCPAAAAGSATPTVVAYEKDNDGG